MKKKAKTLPDLSKDGKLAIVMMAPWIELVGIVWALWSIKRITTEGVSYLNFLPLLCLLLILVLKVVSIPGLRARKKVGWNAVFYLAVVEAIYYFTLAEPVNLIIASCISFYLLFQVKEYYK